MTGGADHPIEFLKSFADLDDPRQQAKILYPLEEILLLCLCAVISGADCWVEVALYGRQRLAFLRRFLPFKHGTPSHDQLGIVFARLDAQQFQRCFIAWVERFTEAVRGVVAIDGKTLRRSFDHAAGQGPIQMISAWSESQRLVLGQQQVDDKSNEITAIPKLLELLELQGAVVTLDAMGCQRAIAEQIVAQGGEYVLGLKGNQGTLHEDVALLFDEEQSGLAGCRVTVHETCEKDHGRLETRRVVATEQIDWLHDSHGWPGLRSIAKVESRRELLAEGKVEEETRYYLSSLPGDARQIGEAVRRHWGVENGLHWVMDMVFRDDECRIRSQNAPSNFTTIKHMASNLLRRGKGKHSMRAVVTLLPGMRTFSIHCLPRDVGHSVDCPAYHLALEANSAPSGVDYYLLDATSSHDETNTPTDAGWTIAASVNRRQVGQAWTTQTDQEPLKFKLSAITNPGLAASGVTARTATLTISDHGGSWYYKADAAPHTTCRGPVSGTTQALSGLAPSTTYTYTAYSASNCADTSKLATAAAFTTLASGVAVSNLSETARANGIEIIAGSPEATGFTAGSHATGYTLQSVIIKTGASVGTPGSFTAAIHAASAGNPATSASYTLSGDNPTTAGDRTFTCATSQTQTCILSKDTTWFLVLSGTSASYSAGYYVWQMTDSNSQTNTPGNAGWTIADAAKYQRNNVWKDESGFSGIFKVIAEENPVLASGSVTTS